MHMLYLLGPVVGHFRCKCPINFSLSRHYDKLKLIGHQTDPLPCKRREFTRDPLDTRLLLCIILIELGI